MNFEHWRNIVALRLRSLFRSNDADAELQQELQYHLDQKTEQYVASGLSSGEARRRAMLDLHGLDRNTEECRDARKVNWLRDLIQDVRYALRTLAARPGFAAVSILSLAIGIGANTAIFGLWNGLLYSSLPGVEKPEQLVMLTNPDESGSWTGMWESRTDGPRSWLTYGEFQELRNNADVFSSLMASQSTLGIWQIRFDGGEWEQTRGRLVSGGYFDVLGVRPAIGRLFTGNDDHVETPTAVISHHFWQRRFGGSPDVLGKSFSVGNAFLIVIGVTPPGFVGETIGQQPDLWLPLRMQLSVLPGKDRLHDTPPEKAMWLHVFGRLKPGVSLAQAKSQSTAIFQAGMQSFYGAEAIKRRPDFLDQTLQIWPAARGASSKRSSLSGSLATLLAAVGVLLLIVCTNLTNLLLARGVARRGEFALRLSLGASRGRIIRHLAAESLTLAALGGAAAVAVAYFSYEGLVQMLAASDARFHMSFTLDPLVLLFVTAATLGAAFVFGALPALQVTKTDAATYLKEHNRGATGSFGRLRSARFLVSLQLALSLPLLVAGGLLAQTLHNLQRADLGFPAERLLMVRVDLRAAGYEAAQRDAALNQLLQQVGSIPEVRTVSFSNLGVFSGGESSDTIKVEGYTPNGERERGSATDVVGAGYFSTLGVPVLLGREILDSDSGDAPKVCVINEAFAKQFFKDRNPIGMHITSVADNNIETSYQVVGVTKNARTQQLRGAIRPRYYVAGWQSLEAVEAPTMLIRTVGQPAAVADAVRKAVQRVNATMPVLSAESIGDQVMELTADDRMTAQLAMAFGGVALMLSGIGLYGVLSYGVARRTGEIAIRIALGARPGRVIWMILRETTALVGVGVAVGGGLAYAASRLIDNRLYGVAPQDPLTLALATALLLLVALAAAFLPAHRASRVDPMVALRHQ